MLLFFLILGENAVIEYRWIEDSVVDLYHTEVPLSHRGKGLAQLLTKVAFSEYISWNTMYIYFHDTIMLLSFNLHFKKS